MTNFWTTIIAGYAEGVSTVVAFKQILTDLPRLLVSYHDASIVVLGTATPGRDVYVVTVTNPGRRPVQVLQVGYLAPGAFMHLPGAWIHRRNLPLTLEEGDHKSLYLYKDDFKNDPIPGTAVWMAKDSLDRWWPRARRPRIWGRRAHLRFLKWRGQDSASL